MKVAGPVMLKAVWHALCNVWSAMCYLQICHVAIIIIICGVMIQYKHKQKLTGCVVEERMYLEYITKDHIIIHGHMTNIHADFQF